jgi:hypothetical protein
MPNLFDQAEARAPKLSGKKSETIWKIDETRGDNAEVANMVRDFNELTLEAKKIERRLEQLKPRLKGIAEGFWLTRYACTGLAPDTPKLMTSDGDAVSYVVQDRSSSAALKDEQLATLTELVGSDQVAELVRDERVFAFNPSVMAELNAAGESVQDAVADAVSKALSQLKRRGIISEEQLAGLLIFQHRRLLKPGVLDDVASICDRDVGRMRLFLEAVGPASVRFVRAG